MEGWNKKGEEKAGKHHTAFNLRLEEKVRREVDIFISLSAQKLP